MKESDRQIREYQKRDIKTDSGMPDFVQLLSSLNPMRWFLEILRGIIQKGVGLESLWRAVLGQLILAVFFLTMAVTRFQKTIS